MIERGILIGLFTFCQFARSIINRRKGAMFTERLNQVMKKTGAKSSDLARIIGCDRSGIDRIAKGSRTPKKHGESIGRIVSALYLFADENGTLDQILSVLKSRKDADVNRIQYELIEWLYAGEAEPAAKPRARKDPNLYRSFGQKFNAVMELAELSNIRVGKMLNVDASYISKFRKGLASPASNPHLSERTCQLLLKQLSQQKKLSALASLTGIAEEELLEEETAIQRLHSWLLDLETENTAPFVARVVSPIASFSSEIALPPLSFDQAADPGILNDLNEVYFGEAGLQKAVIRFLGNVIRRGKKELFLYSDQNMDWMVQNPSFQAKWASLMVLCINNGVRINIIHNINRNLMEMADAIRSWSPLYPSGLIQSYYCKLPNKARFSTTLFLCPGYACIFGSNVIGTEKESGLYRFDTGSAKLESHEAAWKKLHSHSGPLARVCRTSNPSSLFPAGSETLIFVCNRLSVASMPEEVVHSVLSRHHTDKKTSEQIVSFWRNQKDLLEQTARVGSFREYMPVPDKEAIENQHVPMAFPDASFYYTKEEFTAHIKNFQISL